MTQLMDKIKNRRESIIQIASKYGANNIRIFGSISRGDDNLESDIDLLVNFDEERTLFDLINLKLELEDLLNRKVDLVTERALHPLIHDRVLQEAVQI
ncbi:MAG: nucleotidyltransferase family protein [Syntrophomonas sp.]